METMARVPPTQPETKEQEQALLYCSSDRHSHTQQWPAAHLSDPPVPLNSPTQASTMETAEKHTHHCEDQ